MAAIDDLKAAVTAENTALATLSTDITSLSSEVDAAIAALSAALGSGNADAIAQAVGSLQTSATTLQSIDAAVKTSTANLTAAVTPPAPPTP